MHKIYLSLSLRQLSLTPKHCFHFCGFAKAFSAPPNFVTLKCLCAWALAAHCRGTCSILERTSPKHGLHSTQASGSPVSPQARENGPCIGTTDWFQRPAACPVPTYLERDSQKPATESDNTKSTYYPAKKCSRDRNIQNIIHY